MKFLKSGNEMLCLLAPLAAKSLRKTGARLSLKSSEKKEGRKEEEQDEEITRIGRAIRSIWSKLQENNAARCLQNPVLKEVSAREGQKIDFVGSS